MALPRLTPNQTEQIARIMGDTVNGFTGSEIGHHLAQCRINDPNPELTKWKRLYNALCSVVNGSGSTNAIYQFIQYCMNPAQGLQNPKRYNWMRLELNMVLMLVGIEIRDDGHFYLISHKLFFEKDEKLFFFIKPIAVDFINQIMLSAV